ncbi:hypothetical protein KMW28_27075 [Flammeovirga yaeyamensis]|uniref:Lipoprotein n=1 Tax=Flammeovirga yaeyamensis TaxID=367791 RepID=A0AAX1NEE0_9BACT|nr:hypothetical protein [Flammeovirga yaeyamensis]MBB3700058.1 hypothetical protein [Flammeovirga yaeyamensis]NMF37506.1 hypothetical protein [Flammeovirga yaeyamensis]QWG04563.1 hypothetical protein KMW28_27075 [Flammeovirga yaeyamensis]
MQKLLIIFTIGLTSCFSRENDHVTPKFVEESMTFADFRQDGRYVSIATEDTVVVMEHPRAQVTLDGGVYFWTTVKEFDKNDGVFTFYIESGRSFTLDQRKFRII